MIKKMFVFIFSLLGSLSLMHAAPSEQATKSMMLADVELIKSILEVKYAPAEWKKDYAGWSLESEVQSVKNEVLQKNLSTRDYQKLLLSFFNSMQDYHVTVQFYATEMSLLPLRIHGAEGRYFIAWKPQDASLYAPLDPELANMLSKIKEGDEVLSMGGKPIEEYVEHFRAQAFGDVVSGSNQMLAEQYLMLRLAKMGHEVEQGEISFVIKHQETGVVKMYSPHWVYVPEKIKNHYQPAASLMKTKEVQKKTPQFFNKQMITPLQKTLENAQKEIKKYFVEEGLKNGEADTDFLILGQHQSFVPPLGEEILWKNADSHYHAYIFKMSDGKKIGYIRIPTFAVFGQEYREFESIIQHYQTETDALVIDQVNNPGGLVVYLFSLLSMLSDRPLFLPQERHTITQQDVLEALEILNDPEGGFYEWEEELRGFTLTDDDKESLMSYMEFIVNEWNEGRSYTHPHFFYGLSSIKPHPTTTYNKPILILVNYLDFSCADFFPAILQDNGRAKVFGTKTAGAGGYVLEHSYPNLLGIEGFSYTGSIAFRINNQPLENLGVSPDYAYELSVDDLTNGYKGYKKAVEIALSKLFK